MTEIFSAEAGDSIKATIALLLPLATILIVVGVAIALLVAVRKRTGRPKSSSVLVFIGWMLGWGAVQHLSNARSYEEVSWPGFFAQMLVAIAFVIYGYRKSELRKQLGSERGQGDTNDHVDNSVNDADD